MLCFQWLAILATEFDFIRLSDYFLLTAAALVALAAACDCMTVGIAWNFCVIWDSKQLKLITKMYIKGKKLNTRTEKNMG